MKDEGVRRKRPQPRNPKDGEAWGVRGVAWNSFSLRAPGRSLASIGDPPPRAGRVCISVVTATPGHDVGFSCHVDPSCLLSRQAWHQSARTGAWGASHRGVKGLELTSSAWKATRGSLVRNSLRGWPVGHIPTNTSRGSQDAVTYSEDGISPTLSDDACFCAASMTQAASQQGGATRKAGGSCRVAGLASTSSALGSGRGSVGPTCPPPTWWPGGGCISWSPGSRPSLHFARN